MRPDVTQNAPIENKKVRPLPGLAWPGKAARPVHPYARSRKPEDASLHGHMAASVRVLKHLSASISPILPVSPIDHPVSAPCRAHHKKGRSIPLRPFVKVKFCCVSRPYFSSTVTTFLPSTLRPSTFSNFVATSAMLMPPSPDSMTSAKASALSTSLSNWMST